MNELTDREKSVMLARLCGWIWLEKFQYHDYRLLDANDNEIYDGDWEDMEYLNLYDPANMALAKRVMVWSFENMDVSIHDTHTIAMDFTYFETEEALDKILTLAIEAGLVPTDTPPPAAQSPNHS